MDVKQLSLCYFNSHSSVEEHSYFGLFIISNSSFMNSQLLSFIKFYKELFITAFITLQNMNIQGNVLLFLYISCSFLKLIIYILLAGGTHFYITIFINLPSFGVMFINSFPVWRLCKYSTIHFLLEFVWIQFLFIILIKVYCAA